MWLIGQTARAAGKSQLKMEEVLRAGKSASRAGKQRRCSRHFENTLEPDTATDKSKNVQGEKHTMGSWYELASRLTPPETGGVTLCRSTIAIVNEFMEEGHN